MNILFYVTCTPNPVNGGIERVTHVLASELKNRGYNLYCVYVRQDGDVEKYLPYVKVKHIDFTDDSAKIEFIQFIRDNNIDLIVNQQGNVPEAVQFCSIIRDEVKKKLVNVHHNTPLEALLLQDRIEHEKEPRTFKQKLRKILFAFFPQIFIYKICYNNKCFFESMESKCDKFVFLSPTYIDDIIKYFNVKSNKLFTSIPNPLVYDNTDVNINNKDKIVLIVARFDEYQKRLSKALLIWKSLEPYIIKENWKLQLIGHGPDDQLYRDMILNLEIKNIEWLGKQKPDAYYEKASIFMMTSAYEGWAMTLVEAMQKGVVPIVYNSYSSLSKIVTNNRNGIIIDNNDEQQYIQKLHDMMCEHDKRELMAKHAKTDITIYDKKNIVDEWEVIFNELR